MVLVSTVFYKQDNKTLYLLSSDEGYSVATVDYITADIKYDEKYTTASDDWSNVNFRKESGGFLELLSACYQQFLIERTKYFKHNQQVNLEQLPYDLYNLLGADYIKWLTDNELEVETNGETVIIDSDYNNPIEHDQYILDCQELLDYMEAEFKKTDKEDADKEWEVFNNYRATIGFAGKQIILPSCAAVYNALTDALKFIISEE